MSRRNKFRLWVSMNWAQVGIPLAALIMPMSKVGNFKGTKKTRLVAVYMQISFFCFHLNLDFPQLKGKWVSLRKEVK